MPNAKNTAASEAAVKKAEPTYTKDQVAVSKRYANRRDLVNVLLEDGKGLKAVLHLNEVVGVLQHGAEDGAVHF